MMLWFFAFNYGKYYKITFLFHYNILFWAKRYIRNKYFK